jgi:DNA-binding LacI/PurR family transcriptional regulator
MQTPFKYIDIAKVIRERIAQGDYAVNALPSGRKLAAELGVSYLTARRAIAHLVESGDLDRTASGRLALNAQPQVAGPKVAMLIPTNDSLSEVRWYRALHHAVAQREGSLRACYYMHANDPVITDTIEADFDAIVLIAPHKMSPLLRSRLTENRHRLVTLFTDMTDIGVSCVDGGGVSAISQLLVHLKTLGHQRVDCIYTGYEGPELTDRINGWRDALKIMHLQGELRMMDYDPKDDASARACKLVERLIDEDRLECTALFCTTPYAAMGVIRATANKGITLGKDLSVCTFGGYEMASMLTPTVTTVITGDEQAILSEALDWMRNPKADRKARVIEPTQLSLFIGQSTGPTN